MLRPDCLVTDRSLCDQPARRSNRGLLTPEDQSEYGNYVNVGAFFAILKFKARRLLANSQGE
jgi:hypothetical protein